MAAQRSYAVEKKGLVKELKDLRTREGFTPRRIHQAPGLLAVLGGEQQGYDALLTRFKAALDSLPEQEQKNVNLLRASYGFFSEHWHRTLWARRDSYRKVSKISYDTQETRENAIITELAITLLESHFKEAFIPAEPPVPHGGTLIESLAVKTYMRDRHFVEHVQARNVISLVDGKEYFEYQCYAKTILEPLDGITVKTEYTDSGGSLHLCCYPRPLKRGDSHCFAFRETLCRYEDGKPPGNFDFAGQCFIAPTLSYWQQVRFEGERPAVVWWYSKEPPVSRYGKPNEKNTLRVNKDGIVEFNFTQLYGGCYYGIAWRWEE
jgi:hypothetical protein